MFVRPLYICAPVGLKRVLLVYQVPGTQQCSCIPLRALGIQREKMSKINRDFTALASRTSPGRWDRECVPSPRCNTTRAQHDMTAKIATTTSNNNTTTNTNTTLLAAIYCSYCRSFALLTDASTLIDRVSQLFGRCNCGSQKRYTRLEPLQREKVSKLNGDYSTGAQSSPGRWCTEYAPTSK